MKTSNKYIDIQNEVINKYNVTIVANSTCWHRIHAHVKERRVCKWKQVNSIESTFTLFHEIGHIETTKSKMRRCESEYYATVWAMDRCKEYGLTIPDKIIQVYQDYIDQERDRGLRRGGQNLPEFRLLNHMSSDCDKPTGDLSVAATHEPYDARKWRVGFKREGQWVYTIFSDRQKMMDTIQEKMMLCEKISINIHREKFTL